MKPPADPYARTTHDGNTVNWRTKAFLLEMEKRLGYELTVKQGSYNTSVSQSSGTHDGGGVVDLAGYDAENKVRVSRELGGFAWRRLPSQGDWPEHVHMGVLGDHELSDSAKAQARDYRRGLDGLASHSADHTWRPDPIPHFNYQAWRNNADEPTDPFEEIMSWFKDKEEFLDAVAQRVKRELLGADLFPHKDKDVTVRTGLAKDYAEKPAKKAAKK